MAEYVEEKYAKEVLEMKDSFDAFDSLIPPNKGEIYINNKGAVVMSVSALISIMENPKVDAEIAEKLVRGFVGERKK